MSATATIMQEKPMQKPKDTISATLSGSKGKPSKDELKKLYKQGKVAPQRPKPAESGGNGKVPKKERTPQEEKAALAQMILDATSAEEARELRDTFRTEGIELSDEEFETCLKTRDGSIDVETKKAPATEPAAVTAEPEAGTIAPITETGQKEAAEIAPSVPEAREPEPYEVVTPEGQKSLVMPGEELPEESAAEVLDATTDGPTLPISPAPETVGVYVKTKKTEAVEPSPPPADTRQIGTLPEAKRDLIEFLRKRIEDRDKERAALAGAEAGKKRSRKAGPAPETPLTLAEEKTPEQIRAFEQIAQLTKDAKVLWEKIKSRKTLSEARKNEIAQLHELFARRDNLTRLLFFGGIRKPERRIAPQAQRSLGEAARSQPAYVDKVRPFGIDISPEGLRGAKERQRLLREESEQRKQEIAVARKKKQLRRTEDMKMSQKIKDYLAALEDEFASAENLTPKEKKAFVSKRDLLEKISRSADPSKEIGDAFAGGDLSKDDYHTLTSKETGRVMQPTEAEDNLLIDLLFAGGDIDEKEWRMRKNP